MGPGIRSKILNIRLISSVIAGLMLAGCGGSGAADEAEGTITPTPWPTLAPAATLEGQMPVIAPTAVTSPQLLVQHRVDLSEALMAIFPIEGSLDTPIRVEVIVLNGRPDIQLAIRNSAGDVIVKSDTGDAGQPEVIGQFQFPGEGFYELGIGSKAGEGQVGVSIYSLPPAEIQSGGTFAGTNEELRGTMSQPSTFHTFRLPLERGVRVDIGAEALNSELDLIFNLYDPDGLLLAVKDDNVDKNPYMWHFMPDKTGVYTIVLSNYDEYIGDYLLRVTESESAGDLVFGARTEIELEGNPRKSSFLTFSGRALDAIAIEATPLDAGMDVTMSLYDAFGNVVMIVNDWGGVATETMTQVQLPFTGSYQMEFTTLGESGRMQYYARSIKQVDIDTGGPIVPGGLGQIGEITGSGSVITYLFNASEGDLIGIDIRVPYGSDLDLGFDLFGPDGTLLIVRDDVAGLLPLLDRYEIVDSGQYALCIWTKGDARGSFDIYVTDPGAPASR